MKKIPILLLCLTLVLSASACGRVPANQNPPQDMPQGVDLATYLKTAKLPQNLSVTFDPSVVQSPASASTYSASFLAFDKDTVMENLLRREVVATQNYAEGPWFQTGDEALTEYLILYDGGKSLGMNSGVDGGIGYSAYIDGNSLVGKLSAVVSVYPGFPSYEDQVSKYGIKTDYASFAGLSFTGYANALAAVEKVLNAVGFPRHAVAEAYSLDLATIEKHYSLYKAAAADKSRKKADEVSWSKDDECYMFLFRQMVDGIPLADVNWQEGTRAVDEATESYITVYYSKDGVIRIEAQGIFDVSLGGEDYTLISAVQALDTVIDSYSEIVLDRKTEIVSMELNYVGIKTADGYELVPAWIFGIDKASQSKDSNDDTMIPYDGYSYYVVNAVTGERIIRAGEGGAVPQ